MRATDTALRRAAVVAFVVSVVLVGAGLVLQVVAVVQHAPLSDTGDGVATSVAFVVAGLVFEAVGALIAVRQPRNTIGWLLLAVGALWAFALFSSSYSDFGHNAHPGSLPAPVAVDAVGNWMWAPAVGLMATFVVLLFPDGHLPSPRWRWLAWLSGGVIAYLALAFMTDPHAFDDSQLDGVRNPLGIATPAWFSASVYLVFALFPLCMLASAAAVIVRFRRARGVERQQLKWLAAAGAFFPLFFGGALLIGWLLPAAANNETATGVVNFLLPLSFCTIPLAVGAAVLRYRLYDIDLVINKALVLGTLAFFITAVYTAIVVGVGRLVGGGDRPDLALSIAATAVVAVAFEPVRNRVQRLANRLVYGVRATPYEVLADFADRVGGAYDVGELLPRMARTVAEGVGAARVEVWLGERSGLTREASWPQPSDGPGEVESVAQIGGDRVVEVRHQGELLGALAVVKPAGDTLTPPEHKLLDDVAAQAGLVLRNVRLIEELRSSRERLVTTQEDERRRLERNLHDGAQQSLVSVTLLLSTARTRLSPELQPSLGPALDQATEQLRLAIQELRELARGIHPAILTERGIGPALRSLAERSAVPVDVDILLEERPAPNVESVLYFVVAEALTNVAKYAHATRVTVVLAERAGPNRSELVLEVADDGIGGADESKGSGLRGLADRVAVVDGTLTVTSAPGHGTTLTCSVPLALAPPRAVSVADGREPVMSP